MNSFGRSFRVTIFGESHGESVGINIDGCPAGLPLSLEDFLPDLERRKGGVQKGTTPRKEDDLPIFRSGLFQQTTTGAPITILFENNNTRAGACGFCGSSEIRGVWRLSWRGCVFGTTDCRVGGGGGHSQETDGRRE